ncbi:MAG: hypothetical protein WD490_04240 [Opitutales bacterium]
MSRLVNTIAGRLSLRPPQRESLEILHRVTEILPPAKERDLAAALEVIQSEYPHIKHSQRRLAELIYRQMMNHQREETTSYSAKVTRGFSELKPCAYTVDRAEELHDFRSTPASLARIRQMAFNGFKRCLYPIQKFDSDSERKFAIIMEDDPAVIKWFKPARGQFQIFYKENHQLAEYQPDFVVETEAGIFLCEPKARDEMNDAIVIAKRDAAVEWCLHATKHALENDGNAWTYALIPHDAIQTNKSLKGLVDEFGVIQEP